jgi:hypothetical protein
MLIRINNTVFKSKIFEISVRQYGTVPVLPDFWFSRPAFEFHLIKWQTAKIAKVGTVSKKKSTDTIKENYKSCLRTTGKGRV